MAAMPRPIPVPGVIPKNYTELYTIIIVVPFSTISASFSEIVHDLRSVHDKNYMWADRLAYFYNRVEFKYIESMTSPFVIEHTPYIMKAL